jgi:queuine tRNA-ribosyltransferase
MKVFDVEGKDPDSEARAGRLRTAHGEIETPVFMPVGTQGSVKGISPLELTETGFRVVLGNTFHLNDRPGTDLIERAGGLHRFMGWDRAILTDSGGYQVFSLARLNRVDQDGVTFQSPVDGRTLFLGPREAMNIQRRLGSDIAMVFDECPPFPCDREYACKAVDRTLAWAALCFREPRAYGQLVFGIVQGSTYDELRKRCACELVEMPFDGYAVGGVSVGESESMIFEGVDLTVPYLPADKPRYAMGIGEPAQMVELVARGVDMFDCVMPTRMGRNGTAFTRKGRYPVKAGKYKEDPGPLEEGCGCYACRHFTRAYIRHLLHANEMLGMRLVTLHNLQVFYDLLADIRRAILARSFREFRAAFNSVYRPLLDADETGIESSQ